MSTSSLSDYSMHGIASAPLTMVSQSTDRVPLEEASRTITIEDSPPTSAESSPTPFAFHDTVHLDGSPLVLEGRSLPTGTPENDTAPSAGPVALEFEGPFPVTDPAVVSLIRGFREFAPRVEDRLQHLEAVESLLDDLRRDVLPLIQARIRGLEQLHVTPNDVDRAVDNVLDNVGPSHLQPPPYADFAQDA